MKKFPKFKTWKIILFLFLTSCLIGTSLVFLNFKKNYNIAHAGSGDNVSGFAWSENIGWISFNSTDCDTNGDGDIDSGEDINGCPAVGTSIPSYGVAINDTTGNFSGYAWSEHIGWISFVENTPPDNYTFNFNCSGTCNSSNNCTACYNSTDNNIYGWAKILVLGDDGWIKLRKDASDGGPDYGVNIVADDFSGWAWNGNAVTGTGIGWINFNCSDPDAGCGSNLYKVNYKIFPPDAPTIGAIEDLSCSYGEPMPVKVNWTDKSDNEESFEVQVSNWSDHCSRDSDSTESLETNITRSCTGPATEGTGYYFRVMATNSGGPSGWSTSGLHTTGFCIPDLTAGENANCDIFDLEWNYTDNTRVDEYGIYRDSGDGNGFVKIATTTPTMSGNTTTYTDTDITSDTTYSYYIIARYTSNPPPDLTSNTLLNIKPCPSLPKWKEVKP